MIDLTPLEVRKKKGDFRRALRGYEPALVDDFLDLAADRIEQLARERSALAERVTDLERRVGDYRDRERALTDALVTAQEMREEIRVQTAREAELALRTSTQEAEARLHDAEQRVETLVRDAEQQAETLVRAAEQRANTMMREAEQHAATTVRAAEQGADDTLRRAQQEAEAELLHARQEADRLRTDLVQVREREEEALRRIRLHRQQQLSSWRNFLERELSELDIMAASLGVDEQPGGERPGPAAGSEPAATEVGRPEALPRDSRAAAAAAVLAQSFLADDSEEAAAAFPVDPVDFEPFEPEPVYEEDLDPREPVSEAAAGEAEAEPWAVDEPAEDGETEALLENAELAGYNLQLADEQEGEPELLLEEPAEQDEAGAEERPDDDDDWLSRMIEEKP